MIRSAPRQLKNTRFEPDTFEFTQESLTILEEALHLLQSHPKMTLDNDLAIPRPPATIAAGQEAVTASPARAADTENLHWIFFDFDKSELRTESRTGLDKMATFLKDDRDRTGILKAYTDSKGTQAYNQRLSRSRAEAARDYLISRGVAPQRISIVISGERDPVALNEVNGADSEQGRQLNRRVELHITGGAGKTVVWSIPPEVPPQLKAN